MTSGQLGPKCGARLEGSTMLVLSSGVSPRDMREIHLFYPHRKEDAYDIETGTDTEIAGRRYYPN